MMNNDKEVLLNDAETGSFSFSMNDGTGKSDDDDNRDDVDSGCDDSIIGDEGGEDDTDTGTNASSSNDPKNQHNINTTKQHESEEQAMMIAKSENAAVFRIRLMVIAVLVLCTVGVAFAVWYYTSNAEKTQFENEFNDDTTKIFESIGSTLDLTMGTIDAFVVGVVSFARYSNSTWPFVTLPDYATRMAKVRSLSKAVLFSQYSILRTEEERYKWNEYSLSSNNNGWVDNALEVQKKDSTYEGVHVEEYYTSPLYGNFGPIPNNTAPYYPTWQGYPIVPIYPPFNWDGSEYISLARTIETMEHNYEVIISNVGNLPDPDDPYNEENIAGFNDWIKDLFLGVLACNEKESE